MAWVRAQLCKLQKRCTRLATVSDKAYQLLAHGRYISPANPVSCTTKTGRHDIADILLKVALNTKNQIKYMINCDWSVVLHSKTTISKPHVNIKRQMKACCFSRGNIVCLVAWWCLTRPYFSYIVEVSFIGGGSRTRIKPPTCRKSLINFIT